MDYTDATALIVVDVQNDFADPDGSLYVDAGESIIEFVNDQVRSADSRDAAIVYTQDWHPSATPHFEKDGGLWPVHCLADSWGANFHPQLDVISDAIHIRKGVGGEDGYSAFNVKDPETGDVTPTGLAERLSAIDRVVVVGLALDYCVKETAIDAAALFSTVVLADGTRSVDLRAGDGARAVAEMVASGVTIA